MAFHFLTPAPNVYNNSPTSDPLVACIEPDADSNTRICPGNGLLEDMDVGSADLNTSKVFAWNREVSIAFTFPVTQVNQMNLFFYNIPSRGVGLPPAELYWSDTNPTLPENLLSHVIVGNQDLSQDDRTPRNVSLVVTTNQPQSNYRYLRVRFTFPAETSLIEWILLSEVQLCEGAGVYACMRVCDYFFPLLFLLLVKYFSSYGVARWCHHSLTHGWCNWAQYSLEIGFVQAERVEEEEVGWFRRRHGSCL